MIVTKDESAFIVLRLYKRLTKFKQTTLLIFKDLLLLIKYLNLKIKTKFI
jgi:hypothetical protein